MLAALRLPRPRPDAEMLRRGIIYAVAFLALAGTAWLTGQQGFLWSATASLWTCLADRRGTPAERLGGLATVGVGGALASALGTAVSATPWLALPVVLASGLAAGLAETRGPAPAIEAKLLYVVLIAACLQPPAEPSLAAQVFASGIDYLRGGIFACLVCLSLIPSRRDARPRSEVTATFEALQHLAQTLAAAPYSAAAVMTGKHAVRCRLETARRAIAARRSLRETPDLLHYAYLVQAADAVFALLIVAAELRERAPDAAGLPLPHIVRCASDTRELVEQALARHAPDLPALAAAVDRELRQLTAPAPNACAAPPYRSALAGLARFPAFGAWQGAHRWPRPRLRHTWQRWRTALSEHLARDALAGRHALRLAFAGGLSLLPAQLWRMDHGYWVAVTVIMVLSPQLATTRQISLKRFAGSLAGALLACLIGLGHPPAGLALLLSGIFLAGAYAWRQAAQPAGFAFCLTPAIILFSWIGAPAADSSYFAALRGIDTALGCLIALASYAVLAPRVELSRVFRHSLDALAINAVYLRAAFAASRSGGTEPARLEALRMAAGRASVRAEQTLQQGQATLAPAMSDAYLRLHADTRRLAALAGLVRAAAESGAATPAGRARPDPATQAMLEQVETRLAELAIRPGAVDSAAAPAPSAGTDPFLLEQAGYAMAHISAAHASVVSLRQLGNAARGRRVTHPG